MRGLVSSVFACLGSVSLVQVDEVPWLGVVSLPVGSVGRLIAARLFWPVGGSRVQGCRCEGLGDQRRGGCREGTPFRETYL